MEVKRLMWEVTSKNLDMLSRVLPVLDGSGQARPLSKKDHQPAKNVLIFTMKLALFD
jgi:hypothetical protein